MRLIAITNAMRKLSQEYGHTGPRSDCSCMMRWLAAAFRYLLMSRTERYLGHAIDRSDFERRLRVVRRLI